MLANVLRDALENRPPERRRGLDDQGHVGKETNCAHVMIDSWQLANLSESQDGSHFF